MCIPNIPKKSNAQDTASGLSSIPCLLTTKIATKDTTIDIITAWDKPLKNNFLFNFNVTSLFTPLKSKMVDPLGFEPRTDRL